MRIRAYLVVFFFLVSSVMQPARAFAPPLIFAAYMTASTGAGTYTIAALAGAIGIAGMYLTVKDAMNNSVRIPVGPNASNQPPAPAAAASQPVSTKTRYTCGSGGYQRTADSVSEACAAYFAATKEPQIAQYGQCPNAWISTCESYGGVSGVPGNYKMIVNWTSYCTSTGGCIGGVPYLGVTGSGTSQSYVPTISTSESTCPGGYTQSGSSCALTNARQATDDKACDLLYAQGAFATANDMNCGTSVDGAKVAPMIRDGKVIAYGTNSSGQPLMWEVAPGPQTWTVKEYEQIQTATQTQVKQTTATIDAATSAVTSVQTQTSPGSISSPGTSSVPTTTDPVSQPTSPTNTPTATTNPDGIVFPDDYARRGEAASAANTIKTAIETASHDPQVENPNVNTPEVGDLKDSFYGPDNKVIGLLNFGVPAHSSVCPVAVLSVDWPFSWSGTLNSHCDIAETVRPTMAVIFDALFLIIAFFIVLGA